MRIIQRRELIKTYAYSIQDVNEESIEPMMRQIIKESKDSVETETGFVSAYIGRKSAQIQTTGLYLYSVTIEVWRTIP